MITCSCILKGKSYERIGISQEIHEAIEEMLPVDDSRPRFFVELWPERNTSRMEWRMIDENK